MNQSLIRGSLIGFLCICLSSLLSAQEKTLIANHQTTPQKQILRIEGADIAEFTDSLREIAIEIDHPVFGFLNHLPFYIIPGQQIEITDHKIGGSKDNSGLYSIYRLWSGLIDSLQSGKWNPSAGYAIVTDHKRQCQEIIRHLTHPEIKKMAISLLQIQQMEASRLYYLYTKDSSCYLKNIRKSLRDFDINNPMLDKYAETYITTILTNLQILLADTRQIDRDDPTSFFRYLMKATRSRSLLSAGVLEAYARTLSLNGPTLQLLAIKDEILDFARKGHFNYNRIEAELDKNLRLAEGKTAPDFSFPDQNNQIRSLREFRGKVVVVDIWATRCGGCVYGLPYFARIREEMKSNPDIEFITLSFDREEKIGKSKQTLKEAGLEEAINLFDLSHSESFRNNYNITFIPRCLLIDKQGCIVNAFTPSIHSEDFGLWLEKALRR